MLFVFSWLLGTSFGSAITMGKTKLVWTNSCKEGEHTPKKPFEILYPKAGVSGGSLLQPLIAAYFEKLQ